MEFLLNNDKEEIVTALLTGQKNIKLNGIEIILKPLKRDTTKRKRLEANNTADEILKLINS
tara:strand:- start:468 stop:650 length:183 start_codon:yes stop_codon:yes gene_type:complete